MTLFQNKSQQVIGAFSLFSAAVLYGSQTLGSRFLGSTYGPMTSSALRFLVVVMLLVWFVKWKHIEKKDWKWFISRGICNTLTTACVFVAVNHMSVGAAMFTFYASMILSSALFGFLFYQEKMTVVKALSMIFTAVGLYFLNERASISSINIYFLVAVVGGIGATLWTILSRPISSNYPLKQLVVLDSAVAFLVAVLFSFIFHESWSVIQFDPRLIAVLYLGLTQVFTGQLVAKGFKVVEAQVGSMILLNDSVVGMVFAFIFFHELVSLQVVLGGICVFLSSLVPIVFSKNKREQ